MFETIYTAGWADMDFNAHMSNAAFLNRCSDTRMLFFKSVNFTMSDFRSQHFGPVVKKDEIRYFKEIHLMDEYKVTLSMAGMAEDGSHFMMENEFFRPDGKLACSVVSTGGWLDLEHRKLRVPPLALLEAMNSLPKTSGYQELPSSIR